MAVVWKVNATHQGMDAPNHTDGRQDPMITTATKITIFRILLIPFFIVQVLYYVQTDNQIYRLLALLSFGLAALSDAIDGYVARRYNQKSELGALLDPLADKMLLVSGVLLLSIDHGDSYSRIPIWMTVTIISRDIFLLAGLLVIQIHSGKMKIVPRLTGKAATFFQMMVVIWILLLWNGPMLPVLIGAATGFTAISGLQYIFDGIKQLNASKDNSTRL